MVKNGDNLQIDREKRLQILKYQKIQWRREIQKERSVPKPACRRQMNNLYAKTVVESMEKGIVFDVR
jgi:dihydroxyacid dehydratase/phosphogluconate dehydratase